MLIRSYPSRVDELRGQARIYRGYSPSCVAVWQCNTVPARGGGLRFRPGPLQDVRERLDGLCTGDGVLLVDQEERHGSDAKIGGASFVGAHFTCVGFAIEYCQCVALGDAELWREPRQ